MIRYNLKKLMADKEFKEKRRISIKEISEKTEISRTTLSKMANNRGNYNSTAEIIEKLCKYFECALDDIMTIIQDEQEPAEKSRQDYIP